MGVDVQLHGARSREVEGRCTRFLTDVDEGDFRGRIVVPSDRRHPVTIRRAIHESFVDVRGHIHRVQHRERSIGKLLLDDVRVHLPRHSLLDIQSKLVVVGGEHEPRSGGLWGSAHAL